MVKEVKLQKNRSNLDFVKRIWAENPYWDIRYTGSLKSIPGSAHYHISSKKRADTGTIELTLDPRKRDRIRVKIAKNRKGNWALKARRDLLKFA